MATTQQVNNFLEQFSPVAVKYSRFKGLFPSVIVAQCAIETGWGTSSLSAKYNNYFGIKAGTQWQGDTVNMSTLEYFDKYETIQSNFRVYNNADHSFRDYVALITGLDRYRAALKAETPEAQIKAIKAAGYATDPEYVSKVISIIDSYSLKELDTQRKRQEVFIVSAVISVIAALLAISIYFIVKKTKTN